MLHILAILATTYLPLCIADMAVGTRCVIDRHVWQFRCAVIAPQEFECDRRLKRPARSGLRI